MRIALFVVAVAGTLGCEHVAAAPAGCGVTSLALTGINARSILAGRHETLEVSTVSGFAPPPSSCVAWRSSDPSVLSISSSGVVSSLKSGRAMVTGRFGDWTDSIPIIVSGGYDVTELTIGDSSVLVSINASGQIVGRTNQTGQPRYPLSRNVFWSQGTITDLGTCSPIDIADSGDIGCFDASVWSHGQRRSLPPPYSGAGMNAVTMNDAGEFAGGVYDKANCIDGPRCFFVGTLEKTNLFTSELGSQGYTFDMGRMNDKGEVVALLSGHGSTLFAYWNSSGQTTDFGYGCSKLPAYSSLVGIDDAGEAAGNTFLGSGGPTGYACLRGNFRPVPGGSSSVSAISRDGIVTGSVVGAGGFAWASEAFGLLNDLVVTPGWNIVSAGPASRGGEWIVATARKDAGGAVVPVLLHRVDRF